jgi:hypothetical protein
VCANPLTSEAQTCLADVGDRPTVSRLMWLGDRRRQDQTRDHPLPQTVTRTRSVSSDAPVAHEPKNTDLLLDGYGASTHLRGGPFRGFRRAADTPDRAASSGVKTAIWKQR